MNTAHNVEIIRKVIGHRYARNGFADGQGRGSEIIRWETWVDGCHAGDSRTRRAAEELAAAYIEVDLGETRTEAAR